MVLKYTKNNAMEACMRVRTLNLILIVAFSLLFTACGGDGGGGNGKRGVSVTPDLSGGQRGGGGGQSRLRGSEDGETGVLGV